jgi:hypothetical protein
MSRALLIIVIVLVVLASLMALRYGKESYKILPVQTTAAALHEDHFETWHEFTSPSKTFSVKLPVLPQHATERLSDPKTHNIRDYDMYVSEEQNGTVFMISLITFLDQSHAANAEYLLTNIMNDMVAANPKNKLITTKMTTFQRHKAIDFSIGNDQAHIEVKAFVVDATLYILTMISKSENQSANEFKYFIDSFQMHDKAPELLNPEATFPPQK